MEDLVRHLVGVRCPCCRGVVDLLDEGGPAIAYDIECVDRNGLVLAMSVVLPSALTNSSGNASLCCFLDLRGVCVRLATLWKI